MDEEALSYLLVDSSVNLLEADTLASQLDLISLLVGLRHGNANTNLLDLAEIFGHRVRLVVEQDKSLAAIAVSKEDGLFVWDVSPGELYQPFKVLFDGLAGPLGDRKHATVHVEFAN